MEDLAEPGQEETTELSPHPGGAAVSSTVITGPLCGIEFIVFLPAAESKES